MGFDDLRKKPIWEFRTVVANATVEVEREREKKESVLKRKVVCMQ